MTFPTAIHPRIAIIGGGPAGLTLLLNLHHRGIPATLYEREDGYASRKHLGGMLDLGWLSGQLALREAGLQETFIKNSRFEAQELKLSDGHGNVLLHAPADLTLKPEDARPEIDRSVLRRIILDAVPEESVKWGHALASARSLGDGTHELTFTNGTTTVCDILVGADGAFSRVRPLVSSVTPLYHEINGAEVSLTPEVAASPDMQDVADAVGQGSMYAAQGGKGFICQHNGSGRIRAYAWFRSPLDWTLPNEPKEARRVLLEKYADWAPWMRKLIANCDEDAIYQRPLFYLPVGLKWKHVPGVALVGDSAHLMSPFAGAGVNLGMVDALEVAIVIAEAIKDGKSTEEREAALAAWEEEMFEKRGKWAAIAIENLEAFFDPVGAPQTMVDNFKSFIGRPETRREG